MTEQEVEALAQRLARIWEYNAKGHWSGVGWSFSFFINFPTGLAFTFEKHAYLNWVEYLRLRSPENGTDIYLACQSDTGQLTTEFSDGEEGHVESIEGSHPQQVQAFIDEYLLFFRRCCWLTGCPIEATAHEKAEWMQGFTEEEIESWNLKF